MVQYLVIGGDGFVGKQLRSHIIGEGHSVLWTSKKKGTPKDQYLDLCAESITWEPPDGIKAAFFCAGKTSILECEKNPDETGKVNVENTLRIMDRLEHKAIPVVYLSTSLVFNGEINYPDEFCKTSPVTVYGLQKDQVEKELLNLSPIHSVVRLSKVISSEYPLFQTWISKLKQEKEIEAFCDYYFSPVAVETVVRRLLDIAELEKGGIWHVSGDKAISYYHAALTLAESIGASSNLVIKRYAEKTLDKIFFSPITVLNCTMMKDYFGFSAPSVENTLKDMAR